MAAETTGFPRIQETEIDGVPVLWAEAQGPLAAGLTFGVGRAHETFATTGLTHLVEHLTLAPLATYDYDFNGMVDQTTATFFASGEPAHVNEFCAFVARTLGDLPLDRLETERHVLLTEEVARGPSPFDQVTRVRFGVKGFGLASTAELGLRRVTQDEIGAWVRERFVRGSARLWLTGPPPAGLSLAGLPHGDAVPPVAAESLVPAQGPQWFEATPGGCAFSMLTERSAALRVGVWILEQRARRLLRLERGLIYDLANVHDVLTATEAHLLLRVDPLPERAQEAAGGFLDVLGELCASGPDEDELEAARRVMTRAFSDPAATAGLLVASTKDSLLGRATRSVEDVTAEIAATTAGEVRDTLKEAVKSLLIDAPPGVDLSPRIDRHDPQREEPPVEGRSFKSGIAPFRNAEVVVGDAGVALRNAEDSMTISFDDCVGLIEIGDGSIALVASDASTIQLDPTKFAHGLEMRREITSRLRPELVIPAEPQARRRGSVEDIASRDLLRRWAVEKELEALAEKLDDDEELQLLAEATRRNSAGLLAVTDARVMFLHSATGGKLHHYEVLREDVGPIETTRDRLKVQSLRGGTLELKDIVPWERARDAAQHLGLSVPKRESKLPGWIELRPVALAIGALVASLAHAYVGTFILGMGAISDAWMSGHLSRGRSLLWWVHIAAMLAGAAAIVLLFATD